MKTAGTLMHDDLIKRTLFLLHEVEQDTTAPEQIEAIRTAKIAFHFILGRGERHGFEDYLNGFDSDLSLRPLLSFPTREDADIWLREHPAPPHGAIVGIGEQLYSVGFDRKSGLRVLVRIPTQQELDEEP
jgi:hypothetical protein